MGTCYIPQTSDSPFFNSSYFSSSHTLISVTVKDGEITTEDIPAEKEQLQKLAKPVKYDAETNYVEHNSYVTDVYGCITGIKIGDEVYYFNASEIAREVVYEE